VLESLVAAGACDAMGADRAQLFAATGRLLDQAAALQRERDSGQSSLFGDSGHTATLTAPALPIVEPWTPRERMSREKEALGFFLSEHPLEPIRAELARVSSHPIARLLELPDGTEVRVGALIGEVRVIVTKQGRKMAAVMLEDLTGRIEATVFPDSYDELHDQLVPDEIMLVTGRIESRDDRGTKLLASEVAPWEKVRVAARPALHLEVQAEELSPQWLEDMDAILSSHPGESDVYLHIVMPDRSRQGRRSRRYRVAENDAVVRALVSRFPELRVRWARGMA
jgi:DNA polymerase-3 subunit alpha